MLIAMSKRASHNTSHLFPTLGEKLTIELESIDRSEDFLLDITRSRIDLIRITYQNRAREVIVLQRLDIAGPPHRNPDGATVACPHLHHYREGYGDKWAHAVTSSDFSDLTNLSRTLSEFLDACNVVEKPNVQMGLF